MKTLSAHSTTGQARSSEKITIHYNYSNANLSKLCEELENDIMDELLLRCNTLESFLTSFQEKIDATCKLLTPVGYFLNMSTKKDF